MASIFPVLRWRIRAVRGLVSNHLWNALGSGLTCAGLAWLGVAAVSKVTRWDFAAQVVLAVTLGPLVGCWRWSGRWLARHRQLSAADPVLTERLLLRPPRGSDVEAYAAAIDDAMVRANGWTEATRRAAINRIQLADKLPVLDLTVIADRTSGELLGVIAVNRVDLVAENCELGWWLAPQARGRGYATEAVTAAVSRLHQAGLRRVISGTNADNHAARRVLDKIGAVLVEERTHVLPDGNAVPAVWYVHEETSASATPAEPQTMAG